MAVRFESPFESVKPDRFSYAFMLLLAICLTFPSAALSESPSEWIAIAKSDLHASLNKAQIKNRAKNVILFIGDGMGISTLTASRIYKGQLKGANGEEGSLAIERLPWTGLIKTYNDNYQTPDSAGTATAFLSGQKAAMGVLGVNSNVQFEKCSTLQGNEISSIVDWAQKAGRTTGVVTTTRITHATPGAAYAHTPHRDWEADSQVPSADRGKCKDIALQMIADSPGKNIQVIFGGGRKMFLPNVTQNSSDEKGIRLDGRNLLKEWQEMNKVGSNGSAAHFLSKRSQLTSLMSSTRTPPTKVLGLFGSDHLEFSFHREKKAPEQPTLTEMTEAAIKLLEEAKSGYFLLVEGGRIDHAHHYGKGRLALDDTVAFDEAIEKALSVVNLNETLVIVTADHSHTMTIGGYPKRGNPILGLSGENGLDGLPYSTLHYANGPGSISLPRKNLSAVDTKSADFLQEATVPLSDETHAGEDVAVYAAGPWSHLLSGLHEQHFIAHMMDFAACYSNQAMAHCKQTTSNGSNLQTRGIFMTVVMVLYQYLLLRVS